MQLLMFVQYRPKFHQDKSTSVCLGDMDHKSNNLQYNTLVCWANGTNKSLTKRLMFQLFFFFIISYRLRALKTLYFHFCNLIKKIRIFAKNFERFYEKKNNTWNIRPLVDELFVPTAQQTSVLYCRLTDFRTMYSLLRQTMVHQ